MDIKERFYTNLNMIREDYGKRDANDAKELENIASGKVSRKSDKKIQRQFKRDAAKLRKRAVTGMDEEAEQLDELSRKTLGNYIKKAHRNTNKLTLTLDNPKAPKEYTKVAERKYRNRNKGIERAADKLSR